MPPLPQPQYDSDVDKEKIQDRPLNETDEQGNPGRIPGHQRIETPEPDIEDSSETFPHRILTSVLRKNSVMKYLALLLIMAGSTT